MKKTMATLLLFMGFMGASLAQNNLPSESQLKSDLKKEKTINEQLKKFKVSSLSEIQNIKQVKDIDGFGKSYTKMYSQMWRKPFPFDIAKLYLTGETPKDAEGQYYELSFTLTYQRYYDYDTDIIADKKWVFQDVFVSLDESHYKTSKLMPEKMLELFHQKFEKGEVKLPDPGGDHDFIYVGKPVLPTKYKAGVEARKMGYFEFQIGLPVQDATFDYNDQVSITEIHLDTLSFEVNYYPDGSKPLEVKYDKYNDANFSKSRKEETFLFKGKYRTPVYDSSFAGYTKVGLDKIYLKRHPQEYPSDSKVAKLNRTKNFKLLMIDVLSEGPELKEPERLKDWMEDEDEYKEVLEFVDKLDDKKLAFKDPQLNKIQELVLTIYGTKRKTSHINKEVKQTIEPIEVDGVWKFKISMYTS